MIHIKHLHDELDETDLGFLDYFDNIEKKDVEEARAEETNNDVEGVHDNGYDPREENRVKGHKDIDGGSGGEQDGGDQQGQGQGEGEGEDGQGQGKQKGKSQKNGDGEGDGEGNSEGDGDSEGDDSDGEGEQEGDQGEGEGDEKEGESEDKQDGDGENELPEKPENCQDPCPPSDDENEECPYCKAKQERRENGTDPVGTDCEGNDLYAGDWVYVFGDAGESNDELGIDNFDGVVIGRDEGHRLDPEHYRKLYDGNYMIVVTNPNEEGAFRAENGEYGWGVLDCLTRLNVDRKKDQQQQNEKENMEPVGKDRSGYDLYVGDKVSSRASASTDDVAGYWEGIVVGRDADHGAGFIVVKRKGGAGSGRTEDGETGWLVLDHLTDKISQQNKPDQSQEQDQDHDHDDLDDTLDDLLEDFEQKKPLTKQQRERFDTICRRIHANGKTAFGKTVETAETGPDLPGGVFDNEEIARVMEITSRGVTYRITVSAERAD